MADWPLIAVRWLLFIDLGLLFGLPLFAAYALRGAERDGLLPLRGLVIGLAATGLGVSSGGLLLMTANMMGVSIAAVDPATIGMLLRETSLGWAFLARAGALVVMLAMALLARSTGGPPLVVMIILGGIALASLAWSGHGAAGEGASGWLHLASDIIHLLAAAAWIAALCAFLLILSANRPAGPSRLCAAHRALAGFAMIGTCIVTLIVVSGLINSAMLIGLANVGSLGTSLYGQLLLLKLGLFGGMLLLAASNRFRLTPAFQQAIAHGETSTAILRLRQSLWLETGAGLAVLALVAWLGTLAPPLTAG
ncbi:MAG TPA: copper homeostasis membrane protein CopD [Sphingobium sp.]|nr:copper homeostasis membrane protein CopD [Sphingobium sp.]